MFAHITTKRPLCSFVCIGGFLFLITPLHPLQDLKVFLWLNTENAQVVADNENRNVVNAWYHDGSHETIT